MPKTPNKTSLFALEADSAETSAETVVGDEVSRFEDALGELEDIVTRMERGDLKLEESLQLFERGVNLTKHCRQSLETAELKVRNLLAGDDGAIES